MTTGNREEWIMGLINSRNAIRVVKAMECSFILILEACEDLSLALKRLGEF